MSNQANRADAVLTSSEQESRLLVETIPALVWRAAPEGDIEYVNTRVLEYLGAPLDEIIGWRWMENIHPDDVAFKTNTWLKNLESGDSQNTVCRLRGADGRYRWFEVRGKPLRGSDGTVLSWYGLLIDIDDRRKAEEALRESEYGLRQIIETVPAFLWSTGIDGEPTHVNLRLLDYSGMQFEEFKHLGWQSLVHPDDLPETTRAYSHAIHSGTSYQGVMRLRRADGEFRWHHARCEPLRDRQGRVIHWYGVTVDIDEGKEAEQQPRIAARLQATLNVVPAHTWYAAPSGSLTFVNKRTADYLGVPKDHPVRFGIDVGAPWDAHTQFLHPDDREASRRNWSTCLRTGEAAEESFRVRNAQGEYRWFLSRVEPLRASDGTLLYWVGVNLDIEELKCAEQALLESEGKFRDYAETASDWFWETGTDYRFTLLSDNAFGSGAASRIGTRCWDHALDLQTEPEKWRLVQATFDSRKPFRDFVYCTMDGNGSNMYVRSSGKPVFDDSGEFRGYRGTGTDVTEQEQLNQELQHREAYLAEAQRLSQTGSFAWSPDNDIRYWSEECYRVLGFDPQQGLPRFEQFFQRIHPDDQPGFREIIETAIRDKAEVNADYRIVHLDGTVRDVHVVGHPVVSTSGKLVEFVGTVIDVTERRRAEQERARLRQLEADLAHINRVSTLGELAASLAHEITQPISSARNNARAALNFLDKQPPDLGEVREALGCVVGDADRAGGIIDRIRDHIKKVPPRKHRFDINEAINEVIVLAQSAIAKNGVSVQTRLTDGLASVEGDRVQLQQVILNLILNAVEAMSAVDEGVRDLSISTGQSRTDGVLVAVRDSGPGIDPEHIERVFEAFYTTKSSGVGMGLSICRSIIDAHGGRLWADANEPRGAVFQFTLPTVEGAFMNSGPERHESEEPHQRIASTASRRRVSEGNRQRHLSRRAPGQRHLDSQ